MTIELPPLPEWLTHDDLDRMVPSEIRTALVVYARAAVNVALEQAADEIERLRADAERYRWLRGDSCLDHSIRWTQWEVRRWDAPQWTGDLRRGDLDAAIDAARSKEQR